MTEKPFTFNYDAVTGVYVSAALRHWAEQEIREADRNQVNANIESEGAMKDFYQISAQHARNRAKILTDAAEDIHAAVHTQLVADFTKAIPS